MENKHTHNYEYNYDKIRNAVINKDPEAVRLITEEIIKENENTIDTVILRKGDKDIVSLPLIAGVGALLIGISKPKILILSTLALSIYGADLVFVKKDKEEISLKSELLSRVNQSKNSMSYENTDETKGKSDRYFTVKL